MADDWGNDPLVGAAPEITTIRVTASKPRLTADDIKKRAVAQGYSEAGAAGIAQNFMRESGGDPAVMGDNNTSGGLGQWHLDRLDALKDFAKASKKDWQDPDVQFDFFDKDMKEKYPKLREKLTKETDTAAAEDAFKRVYERPKSIMWDNVPGNERYRFSDAAMNEHNGRKHTSVVAMSPDDYLDLSPPMDEGFGRSKAGRSLIESVGRGDPVESIPTLDIAADGATGTVTDQDGRHRAALAKEAGLPTIPVAMRGKGLDGVSELVAPHGTILPNDFPKAPERKGSGPLDWLIPRAAAAEGEDWGNDPLVGGAEGASWGNDELTAGPAKPAPDSALTRFGTGLKDIPVAALQLGARLRRGFPTAGIDKYVREREADIQEGRGPDAGIDWARLGGNVLATGPLALAGPVAAGFRGAVAAGTALSGAAAGALQPAPGGNFLAEKAGQIGLGAIGGVLGAGAGVLAGKALQFLNPLIRYVQGIAGPKALDSAAAKEVLRRIAQDAKAGGPTAQDMLDIVNAAPSKPLTLADVGGENVLATAGRMARAPGESRQVMTNFLNDRDMAAGPRLVADVDSAFGGGSAYDAATALNQSRMIAARPHYEAAYEHPAINPDLLKPEGQIGVMLSRPSMRAGMANARKIAAEEGRDVNTLGIDLDAQGEPKFTKVPSWQTLDYVKRGLDDVVESYRDKTTGRLVLDTFGRAADATRTEFRNTVKGLNPEYAKALEAYSGPSQSIDALKAGQGFLRQRPEEITRRLATLSEGDREFYKLGAADTLRQAVAKKGVEGDEAKAIMRSQYMRDQLRPLFDTDAAYNRFVNSVAAEGRMFGTRFNVLRGSQTAARVAEDRSPETEAFAHAARGALNIAHGNWLGAGVNAVKSALSLGRAPDTELNAAIAKILTMPIRQPGSAGRDLLENFGLYLPTTRNYLMEGARRAAPVVAPIAGATAAQAVPGP